MIDYINRCRAITYPSRQLQCLSEKHTTYELESQPHKFANHTFPPSPPLCAHHYRSWQVHQVAQIHFPIREAA